MRNTSPNYCLVVAIMVLSLLPGCVSQLQERIDTQERSVRQLQQNSEEMRNSLARLRKNQADLNSDIDEIKRKLQFLQGTLEESSFQSEKALLETQKIQKQLLALFKEKEQLQKSMDAVLSQNATPGLPQQEDTPQSSQSAAEQLYNKAYAFFKDAEYNDARQLFERFTATYPDSSLADNAHYWIGACYFREKRFEEAISAFQEVIQKFPDGNKVADAYYKQALAFAEINELPTARVLLEKVVNDYPSGDLARLAKKKLKELK
jgi:tol-pal system protein YbgF